MRYSQVEEIVPNVSINRIWEAKREMFPAKNHADFVSEITCCDSLVLEEHLDSAGVSETFSFRKNLAVTQN